MAAPPSIEDGTPQVVVDQRPGAIAEGREGGDMAPQKTLERLVEGEEGEERARVAEHHDEPRHGADAVADRDRPKRPPINLGLFRRQRHHAAIHARRDVRPQVAHAAADLPGGPGIAALPEHLMEPGRAEAWILGQRVAE